MELFNSSKGCAVSGRMVVADTFFSRLAGLMFRKGLAPDECLMIRPCSMVHTFGMRFAIDVLFLSKEGEVLHIQKSMKPNRISPWIRRAASVIELAAGTASKAGIDTGDRLLAVGR